MSSEAEFKKLIREAQASLDAIENKRRTVKVNLGEIDGMAELVTSLNDTRDRLEVSLAKIADAVAVFKELKAPDVTLPEINIPEIKLPDIKVEVPEIKLPEIIVPKTVIPTPRVTINVPRRIDNMLSRINDTLKSLLGAIGQSEKEEPVATEVIRNEHGKIIGEKMIYENYEENIMWNYDIKNQFVGTRRV